MFEINNIPKQKPVVVIRNATSKEFYEYKQKLAGADVRINTTNTDSNTSSTL